MPSFAFPWLLFLLPLAPLVTWWRWRRRQPALRFSDGRLLASLPLGRGRLLRRLDAALYGSATLAIVIAMAAPRLPLPTPITTEGIALVLVVDVSGSMHEVDLDWDDARISRLAAASRIFTLFVQGGTTSDGKSFPGRPQDLMGLVTFASYPETIAPLTLSHSVLIRLLEQEQVRSPEEGQTNIGDAIAEGLIRLDSAGERRKVLVVLSDGEHNYPGPSHAPTWTPRLAAQRAADLGIPIYAIDVGSDAPDVDRVQREAGKASMMDIARITGGSYLPAHDSHSMLEAYQQIDRLERRPIQSMQLRRYRELHSYFGLAAFGFVFAAGLVQLTWGRRLP
jgi:Ca-activated chloride channel family protein